MSKRQQAWRNVMVAATNAGIEQHIFGLKPDENYWPDPSSRDPGKGDVLYRFQIGEIDGIARVRTDTWQELHVSVGLWPTADADHWIECSNAEFRVGECFAKGWIERTKGTWLMVSHRPVFRCRASRVAELAALRIKPNGYKDRGAFL